VERWKSGREKPFDSFYSLKVSKAEMSNKVSGHRKAIETELLLFRPSATKELCDAAKSIEDLRSEKYQQSSS
jgi:hypothetical protein